ncbi:MAG: imidazolonepropionase [Bacillota bacterium]|nr:MAG: imidazolonepropionase [Bacillota bacterium]
MKADYLIANGRVITTRGSSSHPQTGPAFGIIEELAPGYVLTQGKHIVKVTASLAEARELCGPNTQELDATGMLVMPGYVDCHTHLSFAGWRDSELGMRLSGVPYLKILAAGGGIISSVMKTRAAAQDELFQFVIEGLDTMLTHGTTTVEAKSGYGLTTDDEVKQLRVLKTADEHHPVDIIRTFMGAHALPPEYTNSRADYVRLIIDEMLPEVARLGLAEFCDCFCEDKAFSLAEGRAILNAARGLGLELKIHADEITPLGGAGLAAELNAVSAEHLIYTDRADLKRMAEANVAAVLLPATAFILRVEKKPLVKDMIELGLTIAVSSDYNPGTSPIPNMQLVQAFACYHYGLTPAQAFAASTINAAHAIKRSMVCGSLEVGKIADIILLKAPSLDFVAYHLGTNLVRTVIKAGQIVVEEGVRCNG